jgi:hypothetical protein
MSHHINGSTHFGLSGSDGIIYHHAQTLGRIETKLEALDSRITKLEGKSLMGLSPIQFVQIGMGIAVLGFAIFGRLNWGECLPILGRTFGCA